MADALFGGAALGAVCGELLKLVIDAAKQAIYFKPTLERLEKTLTEIEQTLTETVKLRKLLNDRKEETNGFIKQLEAGKALVERCSKINPWNLYDKIKYNKKLMDLHESLVWFFQINVQAQLAWDVTQILLGVNTVVEKVEKVLLMVAAVAVAVAVAKVGGEGWQWVAEIVMAAVGGSGGDGDGDGRGGGGGDSQGGGVGGEDNDALPPRC